MISAKESADVIVKIQDENMVSAPYFFPAFLIRASLIFSRAVMSSLVK